MIPNNQRETEIQRKRNVAGRLACPTAATPCWKNCIETFDVGIADLGVGRKRHGRIKIMPVLGDAFTYRPGEICDAVRADAGFPVRRDVGGINPSERRRQPTPAGELFAAGSRVAGDTVRSARKITAGSTASDLSSSRSAARNRRRKDNKERSTMQFAHQRSSPWPAQLHLITECRA